MQKLIVAAFTALCMFGAGSLAMADEAIKGEADTMKSDAAAEKESGKSDSNGKKKGHKKQMKAKRHAAKNKTKAQKEEAPDAAPSASAPIVPPTPAAGH